MAGLAPITIVLALGAGVMGVPDALRLLLLAFSGRSPLVDVAIAVLVIAALTAPALGTMLLVLFLRKARSGAGERDGAADATPIDVFAKMTLMVSLVIAFLVSASLVVVPVVQSGEFGLLRFTFAEQSPLVHVLISIAIVVGTTLLALSW